MNGFVTGHRSAFAILLALAQHAHDLAPEALFATDAADNWVQKSPTRRVAIAAHHGS
jgi:hypothetical protein